MTSSKKGTWGQILAWQVNRELNSDATLSISTKTLEA
jgi:hypothetical protein